MRPYKVTRWPTKHAKPRVILRDTYPGHRKPGEGRQRVAICCFFATADKKKNSHKQPEAPRPLQAARSMRNAMPPRPAPRAAGFSGRGARPGGPSPGPIPILCPQSVGRFWPHACNQNHRFKFARPYMYCGKPSLGLLSISSFHFNAFTLIFQSSLSFAISMSSSGLALGASMNREPSG